MLNELNRVTTRTKSNTEDNYFDIKLHTGDYHQHRYY